jgi:hypothetical protein
MQQAASGRKERKATRAESECRVAVRYFPVPPPLPSMRPLSLETAIKQPRKSTKGAKHETTGRKTMGMYFTCRVKIVWR